ncbi:protein of unknown function [Rhodovastum atsumiense]|nr:protein of unknown function [Rhodovastum atsumiense]
MANPGIYSKAPFIQGGVTDVPQLDTSLGSAIVTAMRIARGRHAGFVSQ